MRCAVLGTLEVRDDAGTLLEISGAKERYLLALLAAGYPGVLSVDRLLDLLWDGSPPPSGRKSLQAHVVRLRSALEPDRPPGSPGRYVVRRGQGYALTLAHDDLDATAFEDGAARGRALLPAGEVEAASRLLRTALDLWRGEPFEDWPDSSSLGEQRRRLETLHDAGLEAFMEAELALGHHSGALAELERLAHAQPLREAWWSLLAVALYRSGRQGDALGAIRHARAVIAEELGVDPGTRLQNVEEAILRHDQGLDLPRGRADVVLDEPSRASSAPCPYKGLSRYEQRDAALFHGRTRLVGTLLATLVDHRLLVVSGSSGSGKSSVVRAGLLPALAGGALPGSAAWSPVVVVPGRRPVDALAPLTGEDVASGPALLVCDQLEQLWSPEVAAGEREAFLDSVLSLLDDGVAARCVLVLRADHVGHLAEHQEIVHRLLGALVVMPPLSEAELREVVRAPARLVDVAVEPNLVDAVVRDVLGRAGALPMLSTALVETWTQRRDGALTLAGYLGSGGVAGAVARSAEGVHASLPAPARDRVRGLLLRFAEQDDNGTVRARQVPDDELAVDGSDPGTTAQLVDALVAGRLLTRDGHHLELAHESLLTSWPRLAAWLEADAAGREVRGHLTPAAREWSAHGRPDDELLRGTRLDAAAEWCLTSGSTPTALERAYVGAGVARSEADLRAAEARAAFEAAARQRTRRLAVVLALVLVVALAAAGTAVRYQQVAAEQAASAREAGTVADANRLAALSSQVRTLDLSLLLAAAGVATADTPATQDGLLRALLEHRRASFVHQLGSEGIEETALSANGRTLMATVGGGLPHILRWRTGSGRPPEVLARWWPESIAVSPDGDTLVGSGGRVRTYSSKGARLRGFRRADLGGNARDIAFTVSGALVALVVERLATGTGYRARVVELDLGSGAVRPVGTVGRLPGRIGGQVPGEHLPRAAFTEDGSAVVVTDTEQRVALRYDLDLARTTAIDAVERPVTSIEHVALPRGTAQLWADGTVTLYDARGAAVQDLDVHRAAVRDVHVLRGGRRAVTVGDGGQVEVWDVPPSGRWALGESLSGHSGAVIQTESSYDGRALMTVSTDGQLVSWDMTRDAGFGESYPALDGRWVSNRIEVVDPGRLVVAPTRRLSSRPRTYSGGLTRDTASVAAVFLEPRSGRVVDQVVVGRTAYGFPFASSVAVSPDATQVSVTSTYAVTVLDARSREVVARLRVPDTFVSDSVWSPDGSSLLVAADLLDEGSVFAGGILVVDTNSWQVVRSVRLEKGTPQVLEWSPDGETLAVGANYTHQVLLYGADLGEPEVVDLGEGGDVWDLAFSPDGRYLAAGRDGGNVSVLDTTDWRPVHPPARVHAEWTLDVEWLSDARTVVSAGRDETVSLYDVERDLVRGVALPAAERPGDGATFLMPAPGDHVVVVNEGGPGHRFPMDPAAWLARACTVAGRDLTRAEWARYVPGEPYRRVCDLDAADVPAS